MSEEVKEVKSKDLYFGSDVDDAIVSYCSETNNAKRSKLFEFTILPAFEKLAQYHYHKISVARNPEIISECVVDLFEKLPKFNPEKGSRGFPYFNQIAKNFYIQRWKAEKKEVNFESNFTVSLNDSTSIAAESLLTKDFEEQIESEQFIILFKKHLPLWRDKFNKQHEKALVDALIELFENADNIGLYKKKALFFYLKEITQMNSKQIAINLNKIKKKFFFLKSKYDRGDF
jgi:DNA-directed RNA polymerase specialized sigma24 family protein